MLRASIAHPGWAVAALAALVLAMNPIDSSVAIHVLQHVALMSVLPLLLLRACPLLAGTRAWSMPMAVGTIVASVLGIYALHAPPVFSADIGTPLLGGVVHLALMAAGLLMVLPIGGAGAIGGLGAVALVALAELGVGALGMWLAWIPEIVYALPDGGQAWFGLDRRSDQALAGAFILVVAEPLLAIEVVVLFLRALDGADEPEPVD